MNRLISSTRPLSSNANAMGFRKVTHLIFDMDGLLLGHLGALNPARNIGDTERLYTDVTNKIVNQYGKTYTWEVKCTLMGLHHQEVAERIVELYDLPMTWEEYSEKAKEYANEMMEHAKLLPDTEPIYERIVRQIAKLHNKPYPYDVRMRIMGTTESNTAKIAVNDLNLPITVEQFMKKFTELSHKQLGGAKLLKGAERLLCHLRDEKIPFALATSSSEEMVKVKTLHHQEFFNLFNHQVCGSTDPDVKHGKPDPDIFLVAASRFSDNPHPEKCLVFEDSPNGVKAGISAGMQVVMVPDNHLPKEMCTEATQVLNSLMDFKPEEFGLPPFPKC